MITRRMWNKRRDDEAAKLYERFRRTNVLTLVSWVEPDPKRHPRHYRRQIAECRFNNMSVKGQVIN